MKKNKIEYKSNFEKSIESTAKVISEEKNLNILFGEASNKNKQDIILQNIKDPSNFSQIKKIRGMSDSFP